MKLAREGLWSTAAEWNVWSHLSGSFTFTIGLTAILIGFGVVETRAAYIAMVIAVLGGVLLELLQGTVIRDTNNELIGFSFKDILCNLIGIAAAFLSANQLMHWYLATGFNSSAPKWGMAVGTALVVLVMFAGIFGAYVVVSAALMLGRMKIEIAKVFNAQQRADKPAVTVAGSSSKKKGQTRKAAGTKGSGKPSGGKAK